MNKNGKWITTETGQHVFIKDGQSVEEAIEQRFKKHKTGMKNGKNTIDDEEYDYEDVQELKSKGYEFEDDAFDDNEEEDFIIPGVTEENLNVDNLPEKAGIHKEDWNKVNMTNYSDFVKSAKSIEDVNKLEDEIEKIFGRGDLSEENYDKLNEMINKKLDELNNYPKDEFQQSQQMTKEEFIDDLVNNKGWDKDEAKRHADMQFGEDNTKSFIESVQKGNFDQRYKDTVKELSKIPNEAIDQALEKIAKEKDYFKRNELIGKEVSSMVDTYLKDSPAPYPNSGYNMALSELLEEGVKNIAPNNFEEERKAIINENYNADEGSEKTVRLGRLQQNLNKAYLSPKMEKLEKMSDDQIKELEDISDKVNKFQENPTKEGLKENVELMKRYIKLMGE